MVTPINADFGIFPYQANATICFVNTSATVLNLPPQNSLVLRLAGTSLTGTRKLAPFGFATVWFKTTGEAYIMGNVS